MRPKAEWLIENAKELRRGRTKPERLLWSLLRPARCPWPVFRSQHPFGNRYIADFCCLEAKLVVEIDGAWHTLTAEADAARDAFMRSEGFDVVRIAASAVLEDYGFLAWRMINIAREQLGAEPLER